MELQYLPGIETVLRFYLYLVGGEQFEFAEKAGDRIREMDRRKLLQMIPVMMVPAEGVEGNSSRRRSRNEW